LSHQTKRVLERSWVLPEYIVLSGLIVGDDSSLFPDEEIFDSLFGAGNDTPSDGIGLFAILVTHDDR
jgi:hypothetical protein